MSVHARSRVCVCACVRTPACERARVCVSVNRCVYVIPTYSMILNQIPGICKIDRNWTQCFHCKNSLFSIQLWYCVQFWYRMVSYNFWRIYFKTLVQVWDKRSFEQRVLLKLTIFFRNLYGKKHVIKLFPLFFAWKPFFVHKLFKTSLYYIFANSDVSKQIHIKKELLSLLYCPHFVKSSKIFFSSKNSEI